MGKESNNINVPKSPAEINAEWLNDVLASEISGNKIESIEIDESFGPVSLLGKAVRVKIIYNNSGVKPESVIVKFQVSTSDPKREGKFYQLLSESKVDYIPHLFGTFGDGNLVLEDLTPTHSVLEKDLSINQIRQVISILADLQNKFWNDSRVPRFDDSHYINSIKMNVGQSLDIFKKRYQEQLGEEAATFDWMLKNPEIVARHYNSKPLALSHGDVNKSNMLFPNDGSDKPIFIDWQLSARRVPPFDLSYFVVKSLTVEQRREYEDTLLKEYYGLLNDEIKSNYSFDHLFLDYRACLTRSMLSAVMRIGPRYESHPDQLTKADQLAERVIEAVRDLRPLEALRDLKRRIY